MRVIGHTIRVPPGVIPNPGVSARLGGANWDADREEEEEEEEADEGSREGMVAKALQ